MPAQNITTNNTSLFQETRKPRNIAPRITIEPSATFRTSHTRTTSEYAGALPSPPGYPVNYIIDGQQRLASIFGTLHAPEHGIPDSKWNIAYDLREQTFVHVPSLDELAPSLLPVRAISEPSEFFERVSWIKDSELETRAKDLYERFNNYQVPVVTLRNMPLTEVARVFERINSTGTSLTVVDLMRAATWSPEFDLKIEIDTLLGVLDEKQYGHVDAKTLLRTISAAAGFGFSRADINRLRELQRPALRDAVDSAGEAAKLAVDFLSTQIGTPRAQALPYYAQFAVLTDLFRHLPKPTAAQYDAVARWFWLTASGEYFKAWNEGQMAADRQAISAFAQGLTSEIETSAGLPRNVLWRRSSFRRTNAPSKLLALLLGYEQPRDLRTGQKIDVDKALAWQNDKEFHHFFPQAYLRRGAGPSANVCANLIMLSSVTNIWISDRAPSRYLKDLCETEGEETIRERAASCLIERDAFDAALRDDYDSFLRARSETLHQRLMKLIGVSADPGTTIVDLRDDLALEIDDDPDEPLDRDSAD